MIDFGPCKLADPHGHMFPDLRGHLVVTLGDTVEGHERHDGLARVSGSGSATTAASATFSCATIADSTSAVDSRCPETLITSSVRPMIQK